MFDSHLIFECFSDRRYLLHLSLYFILRSCTSMTVIHSFIHSSVSQSVLLIHDARMTDMNSVQYLQTPIRILRFRGIFGNLYCMIGTALPAKNVRSEYYCKTVCTVILYDYYVWHSWNVKGQNLFSIIFLSRQDNPESRTSSLYCFFFSDKQEEASKQSKHIYIITTKASHLYI